MHPVYHRGIAQESSPSSPYLDSLATVFVPEWMKQVSLQKPVSFLARLPVETVELNLQAIMLPFYPWPFIAQAKVYMQNRRGSASLVPPPSSDRVSLDVNIFSHFEQELAMEVHARRGELGQATMYNVRLVPMPSTTGGRLYRMGARSVREGWPPVDLGDVVSLRQLSHDTQSWQGIQFEGVIHAINRSAGEITLRCDRLGQYEKGMMFNVSWQLQDYVFRQQLGAIQGLRILHKAGETSQIRPCVHRMLFPSVDINAQIIISPLGMVWEDPDLNEEQKRAVESVVQWGRHNVPFLLHGPPGTGKTKTLVEMVVQLVRAGKPGAILVCAASDPAADTIATRLARHMSPATMMRLVSPSRPFSELRDAVMPFTHLDDTRFGIPPLDVLLDKKVIVTSCQDASLLSEVHCTNQDLATFERVVLGKTRRGMPSGPTEPHFTHLLIDEAGQATEPTVYCALSVVAVDEAICANPQIVLSGDPRQLGPVISSDDVQSLGTSYLERLAALPLYDDHPFSRKNRSRGSSIPYSLTNPFVDLEKNYRSVSPVLWLPSLLFYHDTLRCYAHEATINTDLHKWSRLPSGFPILFNSIEGEDLPVDEGVTFSNMDEVEVIADWARSLTTECGVAPFHISVIAPFREQVWQIRLKLRSIGLSRVDVGTTEALQGAENRVVIISTVRSRAKFRESNWLEEDRKRRRGLINEPNRLNVALTRAKELLLVVGNGRTLVAHDPIWRSFYRLCKRNGGFAGKEPDDDVETEGPEAISRLEVEYAQSHQNGVMPDDRHMELLVGSIARHTIVDRD